MEYKKLKKDNLKKEKWEDIIINLKARAKETITHYIETVFSGKNFRNEIDPHLGREDIFSDKVKNLIKYNNISIDKKQEAENIIKKAIQFGIVSFNKKREELPLFEDVLLKKEQLCVKVADNKIKELLNQFKYSEDKIIFNEDNFYALLKQNKEINLNIPQNNLEFDYMIRNISYIKSDEYNNIHVASKPYWVDIKEKIKSNIENTCTNFVKKVLGNKAFKEEIKYDIKILEKEIESLNLFNGINKNKFKEIKELISTKTEETKQRILIETNSLSDWSVIKQLKISEGKDIMNRKAELLKTEELNLNKIKQILIQEVLLYPRFGDMFRNKQDLYNTVIKELEKKAEEIATSYINKKTEEKAKNKKNEEMLNNALRLAENEAKKRIESDVKLNKQIINLTNEIAQLKKTQQENNNRNVPPPPPPPPPPACFRIPNYNGGSIVDALKSIGVDSSYGYRCRIAARNGIGGGDYRGRPHENITMLKMLKEGRLIIP